MKKTFKFILIFIFITIILLFLAGCGKDKDSKTTTSSDENKTIEYFEGTHIPTLESVLNYNKPTVRNDMLKESGFYYAAYSKNSYGEYNSNVNGNEDYETYSKILKDNGFKLDNTEENNGAKKYTYFDDEYSIELTIEDKSFSITINKK